MNTHKILLVGASRKILRQLAEVLESQFINVKWTNRYKKVVDEFWDEKFDLIAFGRGIPELEKDKIQGVFSTKNRETIFLTGMAPIVPLLAYQIKAELNEKERHKKLNEFKFDDGREIKLTLALKEKSHVRIVQYSLDFWHRTHVHDFLNAELNEGKYAVTVEKKKKKAYLVIDVDEEEIYIKEL